MLHTFLCTGKTFPKASFGPWMIAGWVFMSVLVDQTAGLFPLLNSVILYTLMAAHSCINNFLGGSSIRKIDLSVEKLFENNL